MDNKGFTLVELLATIVILSLLTLLASTTITKVVRDSKSELYDSQIELIKLAAESWGADNLYSLPEEDECKYIVLGNLKSSGYLDSNIINPKTNKAFSSNIKIKITTKTTNQGNVKSYYEVDSKDTSSCEYVYQICEAVTDSTKTVGNVPKGNFDIGDEYICEVKEDTFYHFFVISSEGDKINLILDRNINSDGTLATKSITKSTTNVVYNKVAWILKEDYLAVVPDGDYGNYGKNNIGPLTAIKFLEDATNGWINIPNLKETYYDENVKESGPIKGNRGYGSIELTQRARLPKYSEIHGDGRCLTKKEGLQQNGSEFGSCPLWLINFLRSSSYYTQTNKSSISSVNGYWTMTSIYDYTHKAWYVNYTGTANHDLVSRHDYHGVRPVISVLKDNIK